MTQGARFEWDESNRTHLSRHDVTPEEAEQVITRDPVVLEVQIRNGERRVLCAGRTAEGRSLVVIYTLRHGRIRVVTAFPAKRKLRRIL
jgi:uncharacterized DUF497 family protein